VQNDVNSDKGRIAILRSMAEAVHKSGSAVLIDTYAQKTALRLGVSPEAVRSEFKKNPTAKTASVESEAEPAIESELPRPSAQEFWLLKLLLLHENLAGWAALHLNMSWIQNPLARQIVAQRLAAQSNEAWRNLAAFLDECETSEMRNLVTEVVAEDRAIPNPEQQLHDVAKFLRNQFLDRQITSSIQRLSQPQVGDAEKNELLREQQKLREQKRAPLEPLQN
jgi:DNA primase